MASGKAESGGEMGESRLKKKEGHSPIQSTMLNVVSLTGPVHDVDGFGFDAFAG